MIVTIEKEPSEYFQRLHFWNQWVPLIKMHFRVRYSLDFDLKSRSGQGCDLVPCRHLRHSSEPILSELPRTRYRTEITCLVCTWHTVNLAQQLGSWLHTLSLFISCKTRALQSSWLVVCKTDNKTYFLYLRQVSINGLRPPASGLHPQTGV